MKQMEFHVFIVLLYTIPVILIQAKHVPRGGEVLLDDLIRVRQREKRDSLCDQKCSTPTIIITPSTTTTGSKTTRTTPNTTSSTPKTTSTTPNTTSTTPKTTSTTPNTTSTTPNTTRTKLNTTITTPKTTSTTNTTITTPKTNITTPKTNITTTSTIPTITDTVWQYKYPFNDTQTNLQRLTNKISECKLKDYPYGWGLRAGQTGCCGNYPGCCKFASIFCWFHDIACTCCGSIWCGPQCQNDLSCDKMLSDSAMDEGSGEI